MSRVAIRYIEVNKLLYELNEKGESELVRSRDSSRRAYLRFTNKTTRPLDVWWRDFRGTKHHYVILEPDAYYDVNSFISHPWEFTDIATKERYVVNNCPVYRAPAEIGGMSYRTNWNITICVRSLRETALKSLAKRLTNYRVVKQLGLPSILTHELEDLVDLYHCEQTPPRDV